MDTLFSSHDNNFTFLDTSSAILAIWGWSSIRNTYHTNLTNMCHLYSHLPQSTQSTRQHTLARHRIHSWIHQCKESDYKNTRNNSV